MKKILSICLLLISPSLLAAGGDDPVIAKFMIDQLEIRSGDGSDPVVFEGQAWIGKDLNKLWLKTEIEYVDSEIEEAEVQLLYGHAVAPYWDLQVGWRHDAKPKPTQDWFVIGVQGLAPYFFEVDAALFVSDSGEIAARLEAEYEWMLTQKWVLSPEVEVNFYTDDNEEHGHGSGLSDMEAGLRLRYEIKREFAPYVGINWSKKFGNTADYAVAEGESDDDVQFVAGIRAWF